MRPRNGGGWVRPGPAVAVIILAIATAVVGLVVRGGAAVSAAPSGCLVSTAYLAQGSPTTLYREHLGAGTIEFVSVGDAADIGYNAMGLDPDDGALYAVSSVSSSTPNAVIRVDPDTGVPTVLGPTTPDLPAGGVNAATFDPSGDFFVLSSGSALLSIIDVDSLTATPRSLSRPPNAADITYAYGYLWGFTGASTPASSVVRIDPASGAVDFFAVPDVPADGVFGAAFTYGNGNLAFGSNSGGLYQIAVTDPASPTPGFDLVASQASSATSNNDGASCVSAPTNLAITQSGPGTVAPGTAVTWTITVTDRGPTPSSGFTVTAAVPPGYVGISADTGCQVVASTVTCTNGPLAVGGSARLVISARAPSEVACQTMTSRVLGNEAEPSDPAAVADSTSTFSLCVAPVRLTSAATSPVVQPDGEVSDTITVSGSGDRAGTVTWILYGPVPTPDQGCAGLDWRSAPQAAGGSVAVPGDGSYPTATTRLSAPGCYSYAISWPATSQSPAAAEPPGRPAATLVVPVGTLSTVLTADHQNAQYGQQLTYTATIGNTADAPARNLQATEVLPPGLELISESRPSTLAGRVRHWTVPDLEPGAQAVITVVVGIQDRSDAESLTTSFGIDNPTGFAPVVVGSACPDHVARSCATTQVAAPTAPATPVGSGAQAVQVELASPADQPTSYRRGQLVPWQLTVSNHTSAVLTDVSIEDADVPACALSVGSLPVRTSAVITCYTIADRSMTNTAIIRATDASATVHTVPASRSVSVVEPLAVTGLDLRRETSLAALLVLAGLVLVGFGRARVGRHRS